MINAPTSTGSHWSPNNVQKSSSSPTKREPVFGLSITPDNVENAFKLAKIAEDLNLDIIGVQDHPYNGRFQDTWTLISTLAASTKKIRYFTDVVDLPMRPRAMLAKASATLDIITKGRVELGIGAGGFWDAIHSYGGPKRAPQKQSLRLRKHCRSSGLSGTTGALQPRSASRENTTS